MFFNFLYSITGTPVAEIKSWGDVVFGSFLNLLSQITDYFPNAIGALLVLFFGWPVAVGLGRIVEKTAKKLKVKDIISKSAFVERVERSGLKFDIAVILGELVKWFAVLVILVAAAQILSLTPVADFLEYLLSVFIPRLAIAIIILIVGLVLAEPVYRGAKGGAEAAVGRDLAALVAVIAKWAVIVIAILTSLEQLGIQLELLKILFGGIVAMAAIAGGLAFGLGGQYKARDLLEKMNKK